MNWYWVWTVWLLALIASFSVLEGLAIAKDGVTLSRYTAVLSQHWPLLPWLCGVIVGGLAVHFWWHWDPHLPPGPAGFPWAP
jgi:hypothetical protein